MSQPSVIMERLVAGVALFVAFVVMASIISPDPSSAAHSADDAPNAAPSVPANPETMSEASTVDPHEGLVSLGSLEHKAYEVFMYSTDVGTRYTVVDLQSGVELGVLMSAEQVGEFFPDIPLPSIDFSAPVGLMLAEPEF